MPIKEKLFSIIDLKNKYSEAFLRRYHGEFDYDEENIIKEFLEFTENLWNEENPNA